MTVQEAKLELSKLGMVMSKTEHGEFRVNFKGGSEATAYYANDLDDAVGTARSMSQQKSQGSGSDLGSSRNRFSASQVLDRISDHMEKLRQEMPREASNLRGLALRLDRVANTLDQHSGKVSLRKNAVGFLGAGREENLSEFARENRLKRQQIQQRHKEEMLEKDKAQFFGALLKYPEYHKEYLELVELLKQGVGRRDYRVDDLLGILRARTGVNSPDILSIAELDIKNAL